MTQVSLLGAPQYTYHLSFPAKRGPQLVGKNMRKPDHYRPSPPRQDPRLSRRRFIKTAGVTVTLPMLPSLLHSKKASGQDCAPVQRFVGYMFGNGHKMDEHLPSETGSGDAWTLPPMLESMQDLKHQLTYVSGLENQMRRREFGDHAIGSGSLLTARKPTANEQFTNMSVDQAIANAMDGCGVPIHSLQLGTHNVGFSDSFGTYYTRNISWQADTIDNGDGTVDFPASAATPLGKEIDPQKAFDRLFEGFDPEVSSVESEMRTQLRQSVLDTVLAQADGLLPRLNAADQQKVDELFTGIRTLEQELQGGAARGGTCEVPAEPAGMQDFTAQMASMHDLMAIALQCDITRVITFMMGDALSNRNLGFIPDVAAIGGEANDHAVSHHGGDPDMVAKFRAIVLWKMERIAEFLRKLEGITDSDGQSLLTNSLVWISSEIADGNRHNHDDKPILLAGSLGGLVTPDRHVRYPTSRNWDQVKTYGDFFITLLSLYGVTTSSFGNDGKEAIEWHV